MAWSLGLFSAHSAVGRVRLGPRFRKRIWFEQERILSDTVICPHCNETLWVAQMQIPLLTCPRCLGVIVNPNAGQAAQIQPRQVIWIEEEAGFDLRGTVWGLVVLGLTLVVAGVGAVLVAKQSILGVILIGAGLLTAG